MVFQIADICLMQNSPWKPDFLLFANVDYLRGTEGDIQSTEFAKELNIFLIRPQSDTEIYPKDRDY